MKHILVPIRVFENGDRVFTSDGLATVIHDEMENFDDTWRATLSCSLESEGVEKARLNALMRQGVIVRLDYATSRYSTEEDLVEGRDNLIMLPLYTAENRPALCPQCMGSEFDCESTTVFAQKLWSCITPLPNHNGRCGHMFLVQS
jgi:hypothetical protein